MNATQSRPNQKPRFFLALRLATFFVALRLAIRGENISSLKA